MICFPRIAQIFTDSFYIILKIPIIKTFMTENEISFHVRKSIFDVYNELGPGLL
ncbi:hypothetical protein CHRY9390_02789 [Chryseobacterium aquaeductus]|uniref:Uncharacterized protein n=1 Tax=Chryseobacterium aquaeductus TaxID=2675056 RepID=A0A9N8QVP6_9FLAO|nr:hypothetical protein CHRY9390_02789 [Chryseobacterium potabilaquae]CAD7814336.1 hypothetical protein CHRY9390_02789 [Chryseobacterium aquaeductus]